MPTSPPTTGALIAGAGPRDAVAARDLRVALLTNFIAPYRLELLELLARRVRQIRIYVSTTMEPDRAWPVQHGGLDVVVQRTVTLNLAHRRPGGIRQRLFVHLPLDTLPRLARYRPQLVISGEFGMRTLQAALYRCLAPRSRLIIWATLSEHTEKDWGPARHLLRRLLLKSADAVIVNGRSGARYIGRLAPGATIKVVNQAVPLALFAAAPLQRRAEDAHSLVFSGRLIAQKGVFELQRALARRATAHPAQALTITWAGDGADRASLEAASLPPNVSQVFAGHLSYDALAALYASSGALVLPTLFDEWGLVVNEAMASGLPVLGSIFSQAVEELVEDGATGWTFDPTRPDDVAAALDRFLDTPADRLTAMREAARHRALQMTITGAVEHIIAAAEDVFAGRASR